VAPLRIFLVVGEPSGDALGARLMQALRQIAGPAEVEFAGVGGDAMIAQGLQSLFPMNELAVMGLFEVLPHARRLLRRIRETAAAAEAWRPDLVLTIDSPSFANRFVSRLQLPGVPRVHYVAPSVWAWRPGRVHKFKRNFDHILALLPFEPPYFDAVGLPCHFVGHPVLEYGADKGDGVAFRKAHGIGEGQPVIAVMPGSRRGEVARLAGTFGETLQLLSIDRPDIVAVVATVSTVAEPVQDAVARWPVRSIVVMGTAEKYDAMAASDVGLAASGTVALELTLAGVPSIIAYRVSPITAAIVRRLARVKYANLINLLLDRPVIPELLQERCTPALMAAALNDLMGEAGGRQLEAARPALAALGQDGAPPSIRAALRLLDIAGRNATSTAARSGRIADQGEAT